MSSARFFFSLCLLAACCALLVAANGAQAHSGFPCTSKTTSLAISMRTRVAAHASSCSFVSCVIQEALA